MQFIDGGVTAPQGFTASGILCGIKKGRTKNDTALIFSEKPCAAAGVFTQNRVKAECVKLTRRNIANGVMQAAIANSGNANACTGQQGAENAMRMAKAAADALGIKAEDVVVCSTGVIGVQLPVEKIEDHIQELKNSLSKEGHKEARVAIMTTDTHYKECAVETQIGGKTVHIGAMCKGSGMIHINMGTMLAFITTDCAISAQMLQKALNMSVQKTYNCVSVDGDTSTNDTLTVLANGMAGNAEIVAEGADFDAFMEAFNALNTQMAMKIAGDGEGATRLIECRVSGAKDEETARVLAKSLISSSLVKAAIFGKDANFGRFLCAMGYSGADFDPDKVTISYRSHEGAQRHGATDIIGANDGKEKSVMVFEKGVPLVFDEEKALDVLNEDEIIVDVVCGDGTASGTAWGCDLTYEYVKINGDYRT
ncbi:MAG: bifunctional glutamate N-acetyltransferase/amino-acid acetyltransferase ArgJ [Treponema sp.]|nr:bifunctional glutamate N-acetyltransferase/amino-acid acetyltransferase ArgJ [Treponema sp.]MBR4005200.1 bifunctional glutamate N-acetyltransferase/amino-acid acetyltransferase ArgJ [Treponema sp.]